MTDFRPLRLPDVVLVTPIAHRDDRGRLSEVWSRRDFAQAGIDADWVQDNQSLSVQAGTVRGLHYQVGPMAQAKLVRVLRGSVHDVAVDIRPGSATHGQWVSQRLTASGGEQLFVPEGFAHGFLTLEPGTEVLYKVSAPYSHEHEAAIRWDDPTLGIDWPWVGEVTLSDKDADAPAFGDHIPPVKG